MPENLPIKSESEIREWIGANVPQDDFRDQKLLLIVPDATRTAPLPLLFRSLHDHLAGVATRFDLIVALGTHPAMSEEAICKLVGISAAERQSQYAEVGLFNHEWDNPDALWELGTLSEEETAEITSGVLTLEVPVEVNARIKDYDRLMIVGPVFPHEVVGFSGGNKYFFPGISGPRLLNFFHWLGALITNVGIIGVKGTPVRNVVDRSAAMIEQEKRCLAFVVNGKAEIYDLFFGTPEEAWDQAADLSARVHIERKPKAFNTVLSCSPEMYDELWTAGKCMYKLEPVVADGGELIIYAPHLDEISIAHGEWIHKIGYHCRDYFTQQWEQFKHVPWGVLAHSTHVRGGGTFENGVEKCRVKVTLASKVPREVCESINLGYRDPATIDPTDYANREDEGILLVPKAGEMLYRLEGE
ncbi:MAG: lactate racemase domain-containing protein [Planctomycetaceae bacterium]|jgi:lactate racemase|nr:lactate racemase domain-containing protein [bacterium]MDC0273098.1 lactate racemase domain-containing protein [Planctomycetaceae bacterium]MDG2389178.1 lactate racemase domain-containing protein [Planctomycetaceae bacterium]